ncbi:MAG: hypothetical protein IT440_08695 [Phycisphaeraceae bacterium]|nr:hypothetical protein [Phycisphaeraceae bacterium]
MADAMERLIFRLSWSRAVSLTTAGVFAVLTGTLVVSASLIACDKPTDRRDEMLILLGVSAMLFVLLGLMGLFAPTGYIVTPRGLSVRRLGWNVRLNAADIEAVDPIQLSGIMRVIGCGGVFGSWGWFTSKQIAWFRAYVSRSDRLILVRLRGRAPVVLSPDDPRGLVEAVRRLCLSPDAEPSA